MARRAWPRHTPRRTCDDGVGCRANAAVRCTGAARGRAEAPDALHNLARLRPRRERRGEAVAVILPVGGGVPIQGSWGSAFHHHPREGKPGVRALAGYRDPTPGKPVAAPRSQASQRCLRRTGAWEEASGAGSGLRRSREATARAHGALQRSQRGEAFRDACPSVPGSRSIPGEFTQTLLMLPAAGVAVRPSFRPPEELCSIPQAKGRDGTETLQHSLVRTLASRTTDSVCPSPTPVDNGLRPPAGEVLTQMGQGLTRIPTPTPTRTPR